MSKMRCPGCTSEFVPGPHRPRFLVSCGHSICHTCAKEIYSRGALQCPECSTITYAETLEEIPVNIALLGEGLNLNPQLETLQKVNDAQSSDKLAKISSDGDAEGSEQTLGSSQWVPLEVMCTIHSKKMEAYCEEEKKLICIGCILAGGYQSKKIVSLDEAMTKEVARLRQARSDAALLQHSVYDNIQMILQLEKDLQSARVQTELEVQDFFGKINLKLKQREEIALLSIKADWEEKAKTLQSQKDSLSNQFAMIDCLLQEHKLPDPNCPPIKFLSEAKDRSQLIVKGTQPVSKPGVKLNKPFLKVESELIALGSALEIDLIQLCLAKAAEKAALRRSTSPRGASRSKFLYDKRSHVQHENWIKRPGTGPSFQQPTCRGGWRLQEEHHRDSIDSSRPLSTRQTNSRGKSLLQ